MVRLCGVMERALTCLACGPRLHAQFMHGGHLATLFSARNYLDKVNNDSALLLLCNDEQSKLRVRAKRLHHRILPPPAPV